MQALAKVSTDATGLIVTQTGGPRQFQPSWVGLPFMINGLPTTVASVISPIQMTLATSVGQLTTPTPLIPTRETIYQSFFNLVKQTPGVITASRVPRTFEDVPPEQKPFIFMEQVGENPQRKGAGLPYNWELDVAIGIFVFSPSPDQIPPATLLNPILDGIEAMLAPAPTIGIQNLDGIVYEARLLGNGKEAAGAIGTNAWAYLPARIFTT